MSKQKLPAMRMREKVILRVVSKTLLPFILLFAFYVQFHGDFGPGGGFQAGVILAAGYILFGLIYGLDSLRKVAPPRIVETLMAVGVLMYGGVGVANMMLGGNFFEYASFDPAHPSHGQHVGILWIEGGVGITVAASMVAIFDAFIARDRGDTSQ